eukprot:Skav236768  [mRNA]  locus=scaffold2707:73556:74196:- [translate_table: standard]
MTAQVEGHPCWKAKKRRVHKDNRSGKRLRTSCLSSVSCFTRRKLSTIIASRIFKYHTFCFQLSVHSSSKGYSPINIWKQVLTEVRNEENMILSGPNDQCASQAIAK